MARSAMEITEEFLSDDPKKWGKLASDITYRRLELLLLREILIELKRLNPGNPD
ncbi:MAG: hypothetical protein PHY03_01830 [Dehalococcoidia bacterium]|nr:hypothetical protein [Dehalococcoidia bacterium]